MALFFNLTVPVVKPFLVLRIAVADHANRRYAKPQQVTVALCRITLKVAVQFSFTLRDCQLVLRFSKVIHTNKLIALLGQRGNGLLEDIQLLLC